MNRSSLTHQRLVTLTAACVLFVGCAASPDAGPAGTESTSTPTSAPASDTIAVTTTTLAPLTAGPVQAWEGRVVRDVCVTSEQSYPQVPDYVVDVEGLLRDLLAPSGISVVAAGQPCTATLTVVMSLEGRPAEYKELGTIYSGMLRRFDMTLQSADTAPLAYHHETDTQPSELASSLDPTDPRGFLVAYEDVWATIALEGFVQFWGPAVAIELLGDDVHDVRAYSQLCTIAASSPGECPPDEYAVWRAWYDLNFPG